jgi:hypothetical protein
MLASVSPLPSENNYREIAPLFGGCCRSRHPALHLLLSSNDDRDPNDWSFTIHTIGLIADDRADRATGVEIAENLTGRYAFYRRARAMIQRNSA